LIKREGFLAFFPSYYNRINCRIDHHIKRNRVEPSCFFKHAHKTDPKYFHISMPSNKFLHMPFVRGIFGIARPPIKTRTFGLRRAGEAPQTCIPIFSTFTIFRALSSSRSGTNTCSALRFRMAIARSSTKGVQVPTQPCYTIWSPSVIFRDCMNSLNGRRIPVHLYMSLFGSS
jgi:hypothetical protein